VNSKVSHGQGGLADRLTVTGGARRMKLTLSDLQNIAYSRQRMSARPGVHAALQAEGLIA
jgi:hypothetical protein